MAFQKNFVVKNGLEVNDNLIFADKNKNSVGIGTTITPEKLQVGGGIGATSLVLSGVGTIPTLKSTNSLISNAYINVGVVTSLTGTGLTYTTGNFGIVNAPNVNAVSGVVTSLSGTISTFTNSYSTVLNSGTVLTPNLYAVSGVVTTIAGTGLTFTTGNFSTVNTNTLNAVSGVVTSITGTAATYTTSKSTTNLTTNLYAVSGVVTSITGTAATYTTSKSTTNLTTNLYAVSGVVTSITGTGLTYTTGNFGVVNTSNINAVSGVVTSITGTAATYTTGNFGIVNTSNINAVSGVVTSLTGTAATYTNLYSTTLNSGTVLTPNLYGVSGVVTSISGTSLNYTNITGSRLNVTGVSTLSTAGIGTLSVTGIATIGNVTIRPSVGGGATVGSYTGIVTYYGDASGLINVPTSGASGSDTQVQYNSGGAFAGSSNFTFNGTTVTAVGFAGTFRGGIAVFQDTTTGPIVRISQAGTGNALVVEDTANPDTTPFVVTGIGSVGIGTNAPINTLDVHGTLRLARQDSALDGGELVFARSSDNINAWALDVYGSGSNPSFRITDVTQSATRLHIDPGGNVGLGSTATSRLHVFGDAIITGFATCLSLTTNSIYADGTVGTAGSILSSTGSGIAWIDAPGGFSVTDDTSTDSTYYPVFVNAITGEPSQISVSSINLQFNPLTGNLLATQFTSLSDASKKTNVKPIENPIETTKQLQGVTFNWINNNKPSLGLIAQEVEKVLPELVETNSEGIKSVSYSNMVGLLIEAIKEQQVRIEELERKLNV